MYQKKGLFMPYAKIMKDHVNVPIICAGRMDNPDTALGAILDGVCDMISLGRPLLADPDYVNKLQCNDIQSIRPCISCHEGCMGRVQAYSALNCAVNPQAAREKVRAYSPILKKKKVLIVGGGVAGCEAARVLALRGHEPVLFEKSDRLGGNLIPGGVPDFKEDDVALTAWFKHQLETLHVPVTFGIKIDKDFILSHKFDTVIVATGSIPKRLRLGEDDRVFTAEAVLLKKADPGNRVVVVGGGLIGCETALWLAQEGKTVTIVEVMDKLLAVNGPLCHSNSDMLKELIPFNKIQVITSAKVTRYQGGKLVCDTKNGEATLECDSVILAVGYASNRSLYEDIRFDVPEVYLLGDARRVANIMYAIWDAFEVANGI